MSFHAAVVRSLALSLGLALVATAPASAKPDPTQEKINVYVEILNTWSPYVFKTYDGYAAWVDMKAGPTCKERGIRPPSGFGDSAPARFAGYEKAIRTKPKLEVDGTVTRMVEALQALVEPTQAAADYYQKRTFTSDGCKRGKELHPVLVAAWTAYLEGDRELRAFVGAYNDKVALEALAATKKKFGTKFRYHYEKLLIDGKALVREIDDQHAAGTFDAAAIRSRLDAFTATHAAVEAMAEAAKNDKKLRDDLYQGGYVQFLRQAANLPGSTKELLARLEAPPSKQRERELEQAHKQAITDYNGMIGAANRTRLSNRVK
ncbi:MAG: DUF3829 domain-containing protein [Kofleriaceae bacterium]